MNSTEVTHIHAFALGIMPVFWCYFIALLMLYSIYNRNCMHLPNPSAQTECDTRSIFGDELYRFEFRVFLLLDWLPYQK